MLLVLVGIAAGVSLILAILPRSIVEGVVNTAIPSSSSQNTARTGLLENHHLVFAGLAIAAAMVALFASTLFGVLNRFLNWLAGLDSRVFLAALVGFVIGSRFLLIDQMLPIIPGHDTGHYFQLANTLLDEGQFIEYASHLDEPDGFRAWRLPGFPVALAVALTLTGRSPAAVVVLNTFWMVLLVLAIYWLVRSLAGERSARLASLGCALYPTLLTASLNTMSELQFASLLALTVFLLFGPGGGQMRLFLAGAVLGLAALTRGNGLLLLPALLVVYPLYQRRRAAQQQSAPVSLRTLTRQVGLVAAGFAIAVMPWIARNRVVLGEWVALATSGGANMWIGHHPGATGVFRRADNPVWPPGLSETEISRYGARESLRYWLAEPIRNLRISGRAVVQILKVDGGALPLIHRGGIPRSEDRGHIGYLLLFGLFNLVYYAAWALVVFWAILSALGRWPHESRAGLLVLIAILYLATFIPFIGWSRYKVPALPFLIAAAAIVLERLASSLEFSSLSKGSEASREPAMV